ncbi:MAG: hypothetical protein AB1633_05885 [Elusimicrobiota bacterium]
MSLKEFHKKCFACGRYSENGLKLEFKLIDNHTLFGKFKIQKKYQGYDNKTHGGIIGTILVSGMINLFYLKNNLELKTAKLNIRFRKPIPTEKSIIITAVADNNVHHFYKANAEIKINNTVYAEAEGYFRK